MLRWFTLVSVAGIVTGCAGLDLASDSTGGQGTIAADRAAVPSAASKSLFALSDVVEWLSRHGWKLAVILLVGFALGRLIGFLSNRAVRVVVRADSRGTDAERENRAKTLVGVFSSAAATALYAGVILMVLEELEIPIAPLLGGVAVIGLAVAFGAQSLIKDFFSGFMILVENQYDVNDYVKIGSLSGVVERITLRITVLRDTDAVHFIPHGQITTVTNMTHRWSRAVLEVGVPNSEDADRMMDLLAEEAKTLRKDPQFADAILEDPEMLGIDSLGESSYVVKLSLKTRPMKQWPVKRELLRRIKKKFDEMGIRVPARPG
jgi:small conductance mechanosensitive channel